MRTPLQDERPNRFGFFGNEIPNFDDGLPPRVFGAFRRCATRENLLRRSDCFLNRHPPLLFQLESATNILWNGLPSPARVTGQVLSPKPLHHATALPCPMQACVIGDVKYHFICPVTAVISMGRRNTKLEPSLH